MTDLQILEDWVRLVKFWLCKLVDEVQRLCVKVFGIEKVQES